MPFAGVLQKLLTKVASFLIHECRKIKTKLTNYTRPMATLLANTYNGPIKCSELDNENKKRNLQIAAKLSAGKRMFGSRFAPDWLNNEHAAFFDWFSAKYKRRKIKYFPVQGMDEGCW